MEGNTFIDGEKSDNVSINSGQGDKSYEYRI
jgi:hypothetical protein